MDNHELAAAVKNRSLRTATIALPAVNRTGEAGAPDLASTLHEIFLPLIRRLEKIAAIDDPGIQQHMLEKLLKDFPQIAEAISADDSLAKQLSPALAEALLAGLTADNPKGKRIANRSGRTATSKILNGGDLPGHEFHGNQYSQASEGGGGNSEPTPKQPVEIPTGKAPDRIKVEEANRRLTEGENIADTGNVKIHFGTQMRDKISDDRKELLDWGQDTVKTGAKGSYEKNGEQRTRYGKIYMDGDNKRAFQVLVDTKDGYAFNMHILAPGQLGRKFKNRRRANTDEQPSAGVLQAIAAAGSLPDWFKLNLD